MKEVSIYIATSIKGTWERDGFIGFTLEYYPPDQKNPKTRKPEYIEVQKTTANRAELLALIEALSHMTQACSLTIYTENSYIHTGADNLAKWKSAGWLTSKGAEVKNRDLWEKVDKLLHGHLWRVLLKEPNAYMRALEIELEERERMKAR